MLARRTLSILIVLSALAACDDDAAEAPRTPEIDPVVQAAINDQLLVDTDLSGQNEANAALTGGIDHALPLPDMSDAARRASLEEARAILDKAGAKATLPQTSKMAPLSLAATLSVEAFAREALGESHCTASMVQDFAWAAKMPPGLPVYPRGAVQQAAGSDISGCAIRAVDFRTPIARGEVLEFYNSLATVDGYRTTLIHRGLDVVLEGRKRGKRFALRARTSRNGLTEVDLVTSSD